MSVGVSEVLQQALALPPTERAAIVDGLISSLDEPDPKILKLWAKEAERRLAAFDAGETGAVSEEEVFSDLDEP